MIVRLALIALVMTATMARATPVDFSFKPGIELARVLETIGVMGKFNVLVLPGAGELKTTYSARLVEPAEALHLLAAAHGLAVRKLPGSETWVVGHEERIRDRFETIREASIALRHASPEEAARHLGVQLTGPNAVRVTTDARTRKLFLRGPAENIAKAQQLLREVDVAVPGATVHLTLTAGAPGKQQTIWKGSQQLLAGEVSRLKLKAPGKPAANGWIASSIEGTFSVRANADDQVTLTAELDVAVEGAPGAVQTVITSSVQARGGQDVVLGSHELGGERALTLTARVELARTQQLDPLDDALDSGLPSGGTPPAPAASPAATSPPPSPAPSAAPDELDLSTPEAKPSPSPSGAEIDVEL